MKAIWKGSLAFGLVNIPIKLFVCEVTFLALTKDYKLRAPVFLHIRWDKNPKECILEEQLISFQKKNF